MEEEKGKNRTNIGARHKTNRKLDNMALHYTEKCLMGSDVLMRASYTGSRSPRHRYMWGSVSTTVASSQAMSCWWFITCSARADIQGSPFVSTLLCSFKRRCNVRLVSPTYDISQELQGNQIQTPTCTDAEHSKHGTSARNPDQ